MQNTIHFKTAITNKSKSFKNTPFCMEEIIEKLKDILASEGVRNLSAKEVAKELGINPDTFNSMKFRNSIPYPQILNFFT